MFHSSFEKQSVLKSQKVLYLPLDSFTPRPPKPPSPPPKCWSCTLHLEHTITYPSESEEIKHINSNHLIMLLPLHDFWMCVTWYKINCISFFLWKDLSNCIAAINILFNCYWETWQITYILIKSSNGLPSHFQSFKMYKQHVLKHDFLNMQTNLIFILSIRRGF